jgi:adenine/guanine phosphoribosyltransferase-like PRPP-binding protein
MTGVVYKDLVGSISLQPFGLQLYSNLFTDWNGSVNAIVAPGDFGVVSGGAVAARLQKPLILARKTGKVSGDVMKVQYPTLPVSPKTVT